MSYVITETKYGRDERALDLHAFARDLAKAMGGAIIPTPKGEIPNERYVQFTIDDCTVNLTKGWKKSELEKVTVSISPNGLNGHHRDIPRGDEYQLPEATVNSSRPMAALVADIKRRVIDPAQAPIAKRREFVAACDQQVDDLKACVASLQTRHPLLKVTLKDGERFSAALYRNANDEPYLSGSVHADGSVSIDRLGSLTAQQFERLMAALYPVKG
jgi:transcriptional antiterminator Rof (Rho-off)